MGGWTVWVGGRCGWCGVGPFRWQVGNGLDCLFAAAVPQWGPGDPISNPQSEGPRTSNFNSIPPPNVNNQCHAPLTGWNQQVDIIGT